MLLLKGSESPDEASVCDRVSCLVSTQSLTVFVQGYEDDGEEDDNTEDEDYGDEDFGLRKRPKKRPRPSKSHAPTPNALKIPPTSQLSGSDSDSDYGRRSKKKKRPRLSVEDFRISSRGGRVPNYAEDGPDSDFEDEEIQTGYYASANAEIKGDEDEIDAVLTHMRDEERLDDPADLWFENIVSQHISFTISGN